MSDKIPPEYICPITLLPMKDPVLGSDGQTYEREAIVQWLQSNPNSPLTRQPMRADTLRPNYSLKASIDRWNKKPTTKSSKGKADKNPIIIPPPTAPDADHYYALTIYQQDVLQATEHQYLQKQPLLAPVTTVTQRPSAWSQMNTKERQQCIAFGVICCLIFIFIIIITKG